MMEFSLTEEQQLIVKTTRDFVRQELVPHEQEVEETGSLRAELLRELKAKAIAAGLYAANMPAEVGGAGLDPVTWVLYEKELGRTSYALHYVLRRRGPPTSCSPARASSASATCCRRCAASASNAWP